LKALTEKSRYKKRQISELHEDLQAMMNTLHSLTREEDEHHDVLQEKENKMLQLRRELEEQQTKITRANKLIAKYSKEVRAAAKCIKETPDELDFEIRELRDLTKEVTKHIGDVAQKNPEIAQAVHLYFTQCEISPPVLPGFSTTGGSRTTSSSNLSSARSSSTQSSGLSALKSSSSRGSQGSKVQATQIILGSDLLQTGTEAHGASPVKKDGTSSGSTSISSRSIPSSVGAGPSIHDSAGSAGSGRKSGATGSQRSSVSSARKS